MPHQNCLPRIDDVVKAWLEHVRLIIWAIFFSMRGFLFKKSPRKPRQGHEMQGQKLLDGDSKGSNDGANDVAGSPPRNARELLERKYNVKFVMFPFHCSHGNRHSTFECLECGQGTTLTSCQNFLVRISTEFVEKHDFPNQISNGL